MCKPRSRRVWRVSIKEAELVLEVMDVDCGVHAIATLYELVLAMTPLVSHGNTINSSHIFMSEEARDEAISYISELRDQVAYIVRASFRIVSAVRQKNDQQRWLSACTIENGSTSVMTYHRRASRSE